MSCQWALWRVLGYACVCMCCLMVLTWKSRYASNRIGDSTDKKNMTNSSGVKYSHTWCLSNTMRRLDVSLLKLEQQVLYQQNNEIEGTNIWHFTRKGGRMHLIWSSKLAGKSIGGGCWAFAHLPMVDCRLFDDTNMGVSIVMEVPP